MMTVLLKASWFHAQISKKQQKDIPACGIIIFLVKKEVVRRMSQLTTVNHVKIKKGFSDVLWFTVEFLKIDTYFPF